ncbi:MAG: SURF1 family protein [Gammaproteobacteria bacterium]|nr:SURF1 family protein [Gammaproteobacteria bacterium]
MKKFFLLLTLFLLALLFASLGRWQWHRAQEKQHLIDQAYYTQVQSVSSAQLQSGEVQLNYVPVVLKGRYLPERTFYLENQFYKHRLGFHVLTPFKLETGGCLLVDRGWVPSLAQANKQLPTSSQQVQGLLKLPKRNPFIRAPAEKMETSATPILMQYELPWLAQHWGVKLMPFVLLLDAQEAGGYEREWVVTVIPPARHQAYAVQWFALAGLSIIMALILYRL